MDERDGSGGSIRGMGAMSLVSGGRWSLVAVGPGPSWNLEALGTLF